jgi:ATP-dependent DNA helicase RecG
MTSPERSTAKPTTAAPVRGAESVSPLQTPVAALWGVGAERAKQLERLGILTVEDLLLHRPRRYEDRRHFRSIAELSLNEPLLSRGAVVACGLKRFRKGAKSVFELILDDGSARLHCRWWNLPFMEKYFEIGNEVVVFGKLLSAKPRTMDHPETEVVEASEERFIHFNRITPVYPLTEGLPQRWLRGFVWRTLEKFERQVREPDYAGRTGSLTRLPTRANAVHMIHFPEAMTDVEIGRQRLALDEFVELQQQVQLRRKRFEAQARALPCGGDNRLMKPFLAKLGFRLTDAQTKVLRDIRKDMGGAHPMRRLLQGDVGSGKTAVAACTALMALESRFNVALMTPTEILAEQHYANFGRWFEPLGVGVQLQTGSRKTDAFRMPGDKRKANFSLVTRHSSPVTLFIGTHTLFTTGFDIPNLGLVIIDEQHKFGVSQREQLVRKGRYPHLLVMTATPIPRTLGLTLYGDLDVSTIDELPKGRGSINTFVRQADKLPKVWEFIHEKLAQGRQAYVVYPRVEQEDTANAIKAVVKEHENVKRVLTPFRVGLLHGRLKSAEKDAVMEDFRANRTNVLLATSLIEVGLDVPNASVMLIENAEVFGLAQLHQLRGRIGRGAHESFCILVSDAKNPESRERLRVLEETTDGFRIAEADLKLRGPGELLGQNQSGLPRFRFGNLADDFALVQQAREIAAASLA